MGEKSFWEKKKFESLNLSIFSLTYNPNNKTAMSAIAVSTGASTSQAPPPLWKPASVKPKELATLPPVSSLPINQQQCDKALNALLAHVARTQEQREQTELLGEQEEKVFLVVGLKQAPKREVHKPVRLWVRTLLFQGELELIFRLGENVDLFLIPLWTQKNLQ